jgi:dTDP-4-dehydrorhamnose reductase
MAILIIGSHGMLGSDLLAEFASHEEVLGLDLPDIDITRDEQCFSQIKKLQPAIILNAAALTRVDYCEANQEEAFLVNGAGAGNLARAAASIGAALVHYSTDYVFNGLKQDPYVEEDTPNPRSVYGKSKLAGEDLVRRYCPNHLIIRTSWLFGANGPNFIRTITDKARMGERLRVVNDQRGSPSYTKDVASYTRKMIERGCKGTYHLTNSGSCTWHELSRKALECAGIKNASLTPVSTSEFPRPAPRPANSILANARLVKDGFPLMRPWQAAVQEYIERELEEKPLSEIRQKWSSIG